MKFNNQLLFSIQPDSSQPILVNQTEEWHQLATIARSCFFSPIARLSSLKSTSVSRQYVSSLQPPRQCFAVGVVFLFTTAGLSLELRNITGFSGSTFANVVKSRILTSRSDSKGRDLGPLQDGQFLLTMNILRDSACQLSMPPPQRPTKQSRNKMFQGSLSAVLALNHYMSCVFLGLALPLGTRQCLLKRL